MLLRNIFTFAMLMELFAPLVFAETPEKIFLHTDRTLYIPGETVWFKGYISGEEPSNYLYVELLGKTADHRRDSLFQRVKLKRNTLHPKGGFPGHLVLAEETPPGVYYLRAYTQWNKNFAPERMFHTRLFVIRPGKPAPTQSISEETFPFNVSFFPEGGRYFANRVSNIGFKALDSSGNNVNVHGQIVDDAGNTVATFATQHDGMGLFTFKPRAGSRYTAQVANVGSVLFPQPSSEGATLTLQLYGNSILLNTYVADWPMNNELNSNSAPYSLVIYNDRAVCGNLPVTRADQLFRIDKKQLTAGIHHAVLLNNVGTVVARRPFFVFPEPLLVSMEEEGLSPSSHSRAKGSREKVSVTLTVRDTAGNPLEGVFSVAVVRADFEAWQQEDNLTSYMYLSSDIKGKINSPQFYFDDRIPLTQRQRAMDLLMVVQGWKCYDREEVAPRYSKEFTQCLSGYVAEKGRNKRDTCTPIEPYSLTLMAPQLNYSAFYDSLLSPIFRIDSLDFADSTQFVLMASDKKGSSKLTPFWDRDTFPQPWDYSSVDSLAHPNPAVSLVEDGKQTLAEDDMQTVFEDDMQTVQLQEITIRDQWYRPKNNPSPFNQPFERRQVKERKELEKDDYRTIDEYIERYYAGFMRRDGRLVSSRGGSMLAVSGLAEGGGGSGSEGQGQSQGQGGKKAESASLQQNVQIQYSAPKVYIDGMIAEVDDLKLLRVSDVETLAVLRGVEGALLYQSAGGVILIRLRKGWNKKQSVQPSNLIIFVPLGWQRPMAFKAPSYDTPQKKQSLIPDYRKTYYWNPTVQTDSLGKAHIEFYTPDYEVGYHIRVEGMK